MTVRLRQLAALALLLGGLCWSACQLGAVGLDPLTATAAATARLLPVSLLSIGAGLIAAAFSMRGPARVALLVAGAAALAFLVAGAVQPGDATDPSAAVGCSWIAFTAAMVVAAVLTVLDPGPSRSARWSMVAPGAAFALLAGSDFVPRWSGGPVVSAVLLMLPGAAAVVAGVLLLVSARRGARGTVRRDAGGPARRRPGAASTAPLHAAVEQAS